MFAFVSTIISLFCGVLGGYVAGPAQLSLRLAAWNRDLRDLSGAGRRCCYPLAQIIPISSWANAVVADPDLSTFLITLLYLAHDGLFQGQPKELRSGARIDGASRWKARLHHHPGGGAGILRRASSPFTLRGTSSSTRWSSCRSRQKTAPSESPRS